MQFVSHHHTPRSKTLTNLFSYTFFFFGGINCLLALFVIFLVPETRNVVLEEMDVLFGGVNHVEKGGAALGIEDVHHANPGDISRMNHGTGFELADDIVPARPVTGRSDSKV